MKSRAADPEFERPTWWLMPTDLERTRFLAAWRERPDLGAPPEIQLCGFGPIAAGILTARGLSKRRPGRVVLLGIGGSYDLVAAPLGTAVEIGRVWTDAVGAQRPVAAVGEPGAAGEPWGQWELPSELGFAQVVADVGGDSASLRSNVAESLELPGGARGVGLLTVGVASGTEETAQGRRRRFSGVVVEDMEGFSVALACHLAGVPWAIWRGITNRVGDRDISQWRFQEAIQSLVDRVSREVAVGEVAVGQTRERGERQER